MRKGVILILVLVVGVVLLVLGVTLHNFVGQQNANVHLLASAEVAHFLAEAGISSCIRTVRESLSKSGIIGGENAALFTLLARPQPLPDTSLMSLLKDTWNEDLKKFSKELDKSASIRVEVWLRGFRQTETEESSWVDPAAKNGWLSIEATGEYKGMKRILVVKRKVWVGNVVPPVVSKFTLHVKDGNRGNEGAYNIIRNEYDSNVTDGPLPLVCLNHTTPEDFFPFSGKPLSAVLEDEKDREIYQKRGWIWLGGGKVRLNITSGCGNWGEIFHYYEITPANTFQAIRFRTPPAKSPSRFQAPMSLPWDLIDAGSPDPSRQPTYQFGHNFVIEGFHDRSSRSPSNAMYDNNILSVSFEGRKYGSKSSMMHLFGLSKKGFHSRTKVFGNVISAFPRYASLEVTPLDDDVKTRFDAVRPPPLYLLPSISPQRYSANYPLVEFGNRRFGGPILAVGFLFENQEEYAKFMSCIVEMPYSTSYNTMQDMQNPSAPRQFPPAANILSEDLGQELVLKRDSLTIYKGPVEAPKVVSVLQSRAQKEIGTIEEFWATYYDKEKQMLRLNEIVRIANPEKFSFLLPPQKIPYPLKVEKGGMIILENGNLVLRGVEMTSPTEALTIAAPGANTVQFETPQMNQVNVVAPGAELAYGSKIQVLGSLCLRTVPPDERTSGGVIRYREDQDPTRSDYYAFAKVRINDVDTFWHE